MKLEQLRQKLLAAARANPPGGHVPFAFEKRIMARLTAQPLPDLWSLWANALWRAAVPCVALVLVLGAMSFFVADGDGNVTANGNGKTTPEEFSQDFEQTMLAAVDQSGEVW